MKSFTLNRRTLLRGAGTAVALPLLEAMMPVGKTAFAQSAKPGRFICYFTSCGIVMENFRMTAGPMDRATVPASMQPFKDAGLLNDMCMVQGLSSVKSGAGGDHAQGTQTTLRANSNGISADQYMHQWHMALPAGERTRFGSMSIGPNGGCGAQDNAPPSTLCAISWETGTTYKPKDSEPGALFTKLFNGFTPPPGGGTPAPVNRMNESVLAYVKDDANKLKQRLGASDKAILEQYETSVRELEMRIAASTPDTTTGGGSSCVVPDAPEAYGANWPLKCKLLADLTVLAIQCDQARYFAWMLENGGDYRVYNHLGMTRSHHAMSHDNGVRQQTAQIDRWMMTEMAYLVKGLKDAKDPTGASLLDSCFVALTNEISHGNNHNHDDMPFLSAGSCNGFFKTGQSLTATGPTAWYGNVWVSACNAVGLDRNTIGNSTGPCTVLHA
jgi:Protein of unknown function (DUF1552)